MENTKYVKVQEVFYLNIQQYWDLSSWCLVTSGHVLWRQFSGNISDRDLLAVRAREVNYLGNPDYCNRVQLSKAVREAVRKKKRLCYENLVIPAAKLRY